MRVNALLLHRIEKAGKRSRRRNRVGHDQVHDLKRFYDLGRAADMILVRMGEDHIIYLLGIFFKIGDKIVSRIRRASVDQDTAALRAEKFRVSLSDIYEMHFAFPFRGRKKKFVTEYAENRRRAQNKCSDKRFCGNFS